jgi:prefoldin subunit 5
MPMKGKGVNVFMLMGKLRSLDKQLKELKKTTDNMNTKLDDIRRTLNEIKPPIVKALERSE